MFQVENKYSMTSFWCFYCYFDHVQHTNIVFLLLTLNKYLSVGYEKQVIMVWKNKKRYICFLIKVARLVSFRDLSLPQIEIIINKWPYYEHIMKILWTYVSALNLLQESQAIIVSTCYLICLIIPVSQRFNLFCCIK